MQQNCLSNYVTPLSPRLSLYLTCQTIKHHVCDFDIIIFLRAVLTSSPSSDTFHFGGKTNIRKNDNNRAEQIKNLQHANEKRFGKWFLK